MADPNAPPTENVFDQFDDAKPAPNVFDQFDDEPGQKIAAPHMSTMGSFARGAERSALPAAGGLAAAGLGAEVGGALGTAVFPGPGTAIGALAGGIGGMFLGAAGVDAVQDWALRQLPDSWRESIGMGDRQQRLDEAQHPTASFLGGLAPYAVTMRPSFSMAKAALPENATALQRIMANPVTARVFGGGAMGGMELAQEAYRGDVDWTNVAISTGFGIVFNKPTKLGQKITETGAAPARALGERLSNYAGPSLTGPNDFRIPTVAEVGDSKVMGPGVTEEVFQGSERQDPTAEMQSQDLARTEKQALNPQQAVPDVNAVARRMEPEAFERFDALSAQRDELRQWVAEQSNPSDETLRPLIEQRDALQAQLDAHVAERSGYAGGPEARRLKAQIRDVEKESSALLDRRQAHLEGRGQDTPEIALARQRLMAVDEQMRDEAANVRAANRRAAEAIGSGTVPPPEAPAAAAVETPAAAAAPAAPAAPSIDAQKATIAADVTRQLVAAGRPADEAGHAARLVAERYATRAARFGGKLGTALELYQREGAEIRGPNGRRAPPAPAAPAAAEPATAPPAAVAPEAAPVAAAPAAPEPAAAPALPKGFEDWAPGKVVNAGPVKGLTVVEFEDGKFLLNGRGNSQFEFTPPAKLPKDENSTDWLVGLRRLPDRPAAVAPSRPGTAEIGQNRPDQAESVRAEVAPSPAAPAATVEKPAAAPAAPLRGPGPAHGFELTVREEKQRLQKADKAERKEAKRLGEPEPERRQPGERDYLARLQGFEKDAAGHLDDLKEEHKLTPDQVNDLSKLYDRKPGEHRDTALDRAWEIYNDLIVKDELEYHRANDSLDVARREAEAELLNRPNPTSPYDTTVGANVFGSEHLVNPTIPGSLPEGILSPALPRGVPIEQTFEQGKQGRINILEGRRSIITLAKTADASTFIHETGHDFFDQLMRDAEHPDAPPQLRDDAQTLYDKLGVNGREEVKDRHHEKVADWFEQYLREGRAPSKELAGVFQQFKDWLMQIYKTIAQLGTPISDDVRKVFDRLVAEEPQATVIAPETKRGPSLADVLTGDAKIVEPYEAEATADRAAGELARAVAEPPPRVANEIQAAVVKVEAEQAAANAGGEAGAVAEQSGEVRAGSGGPAAEPGGGGVGEVDGAGVRGGDTDAGKSADVSGSEQRSGAGPTAEPPLSSRPATLFGPDESPFLDKAGNIRLENLTNIEDVRQAMHDFADRNNDFIGDRQGVVTPGQTMDTALALGMEGAEDKVRSWIVGQAFNAGDITAVRLLAIQSATEVGRAMRRAARDGASDADVVAYADARDRHKMIQAALSGVTAEAGRALRAFHNISDGEGVANLNEFVKQATGKTLFQIREEARLGAQLTTPEATSKFIADSKKPGFGRMILEYWINGLISGPATHTTYSVGNLMLALNKAGPETAVAAGIGALRQAMGRTGDVVHLGEVRAQLAGAARALPTAAQAALDSLNTGVTTLLPGETRRMVLPFQPGSELAVPATMNEAARAADVGASLFGVVRGMRDAFIAGDALQKARAQGEVGTFGTEYSSTGAIPNLRAGDFVLPLGTVMRLPSRGVAAIHSFFRALNYSAEKAGGAYRMAANEGLTGEAFAARVGDIRQNPPADKMAEWRHGATELTLMGQGSKVTQLLSRLTNVEMNIPGLGNTQLLKFIDPFVHISSNVIDQAIVQRTPVGILSSELRADLMGKNGNVAQDRAQARMVVGTAFAVTIGSLAAQGLASGSGPSDPRESAMWRLAGNQAHSVRVGDFWYDTHRLGPMGMLMSIGADMYEVAHSAKEGEFTKAAAHFGHAITQNILDESFMRGPADLMRAIEDPGRYGESWVRNIASSFVPFSVGLSQEARAMDPYSREARTIVDAMRAKIPGVSMDLLPKIDVWGNPMPNQASLGGRAISAIYMQHVGTDPVNREMLRLNLHPAPVGRTIRNVELTPQQHEEFARIAGRTAKTRLDAIVNAPQWQTFPPDARAYVIKEVVKQSREMARGAIIAKDPSIIERAQRQKHEKLTPKPEPPEF